MLMLEFNDLGFAHRKIGDYENSKIFYKEALALQPDHKLALEYQGELFLTLHDINSVSRRLPNLKKLEDKLSTMAVDEQTRIVTKCGL